MSGQIIFHARLPPRLSQRVSGIIIVVLTYRVLLNYVRAYAAIALWSEYQIRS